MKRPLMFASRPSRFRRYALATLVTFAIIAFSGWRNGWFERAAYQLLIATGEAGQGLGVKAYRVDIDAHPVAGIEKNLSGLTYHPGRNSLFSVINYPARIVELSVDGRLLRTIPVDGVTDLEGITHMRGDEFFLADEQTQQLIHVRLDDEQQRIDASQLPRLGLALDLAGNLGFEGVSWDHTQNRLFVAKEKAPLRLYEVSGLATAIDEGRLDLHIGEWLPRGAPSLLLRDLSSLTYHEASGSMLLLSDESRLLVEFDAARRPAGLLVLRRGEHGLKDDVPQAEGAAVGQHGDIYLISEPNLFYRFVAPRP